MVRHRTFKVVVMVMVGMKICYYPALDRYTNPKPDYVQRMVRRTLSPTVFRHNGAVYSILRVEPIVRLEVGLTVALACCRQSGTSYGQYNCRTPYAHNIDLGPW